MILNKVAPRPSFFKANSKVKSPKVGSFLKAAEDLEGVKIHQYLISQNKQIDVYTIYLNILLQIDNTHTLPEIS